MLEKTFHQPWTIFDTKAPRSPGADGLHLTQRHVPQGTDVSTSWPWVTRLSSVAAWVWLKVCSEESRALGMGSEQHQGTQGVFRNGGWAPEIHRQDPLPHVQMAQMLLKALGTYSAMILHRNSHRGMATSFSITCRLFISSYRVLSL